MGWALDTQWMALVLLLVECWWTAAETMTAASLLDMYCVEWVVG